MGGIASRVVVDLNSISSGEGADSASPSGKDVFLHFLPRQVGILVIVPSNGYPSEVLVDFWVICPLRAPTGAPQNLGEK